MTWFNKLKWVLAILLVFFLILMTNLIDRKNFKIVNDTVTAMYEDRIVANDLIFELSLLIHQKEIAIARSDTSFFNNENESVSKKIDELLEAFGNTKMTPKETKIYRRLKDNSNEKNSIKNNTDDNVELYKKRIESIQDNLHELNKIQLQEGKNKMLVSRKAFEGIELFTQIEIYLLIFMAIALQFVIFYNPKTKEA